MTRRSASPTVALAPYALDDRYEQQSGRVFLTGTQALVRILLDQARRDHDNGLETAGLVSGYRGSPLGAFDLELWRTKERLEAARIEFLPAVNEDLAATAILGSQQVETNTERTVQGVFGMWYGKGPGVDRSGDALKHGNAYGSSPHGGAVVIAGDDHGCVSSSMPHQSDVAFMAWFMPTLAPASVGEYLAFGEYAYALSRFSGMWVGFKAVSDTVESGASIELHPDRAFVAPDYAPPATGLHYRWPDLPGFQIEERLQAKKDAVMAFAEANPLDRHVYQLRDAGVGIVTTGKAHLDLMEALRRLGVDEAACRRLGIDIYKVGMVWPLARRSALDFVRGKREVLIVEEKRGIIESQLKEYFYDWPGDKPHSMVGKHDENGERLLPWTRELSPSMLVPVVAARLDALFPKEGLAERARALCASESICISVPGATRTPYFCSGCPHNTSTKVPEGSRALAGIGCHFMASWMERDTSSLIQMGGEGVNWVGSSRFTGNGHIFQNLGEGTWYHSGSMAIRQAVAAGTNITYKILYNDAVAMTGGQPVDGPVSVQAIAHICRAEGVERIALVSDSPAKFDAGSLPTGVSIAHRRDLDAVQRQLRDVPGVSVLIYEQVCATEKRRRRKRCKLEDPKRFVVINELVCEGCGDCSVESNCLSVEPVETEFGTKRRINQSTCNKDYSCLNGFCPSFVTVEGVERQKPKPTANSHVENALANLPDPELPELNAPYDLLVTGVGGTGVVTVGALITMAAHLEGRGSSVLDFTGFAQKFGPVLSYVRLAPTPEDIQQVRIDDGTADALIGCDVVVSSSPKASQCYRPGTRAVVNLAKMPTGDIVLHRDARLQVDVRVRAISAAIGESGLHVFDANRLAETMLGDSVFANVMMLGFAWQTGLVPVSLDALDRAIELNGVAPDINRRAFAIGRLAATDPTMMREAIGPVAGKTVPAQQTSDELIATRAAFLSDYQNAAYAERYRQALAPLAHAQERDSPESGLTASAARTLFRLMAYKDEYEVARLHRDKGFAERIRREFGDAATLRYHMAPPFFPADKDARGRPRKRSFGGWMGKAFGPLSRLKVLRGTVFDPFGHTSERRMERELVTWYEGLISRCASSLTKANADRWRDVLAAPLDIRGYGPVKEQAAERTRARVEELIAAL